MLAVQGAASSRYGYRGEKETGRSEILVPVIHEAGGIKTDLSTEIPPAELTCLPDAAF